MESSHSIANPDANPGAQHGGIGTEHLTLRVNPAHGPTFRDELFERAARLVGYANAKRYCHRGTFLFQGIPLQGAWMLEVGCGTGAWAIWAALNGAAKAVGIDPEMDGSHSGTFDRFRKNIQALAFEDRVEAYPLSLQNFTRYDGQFDVIAMYNVVNHLDEEAVISLHKNGQLASRFVDLLKVVRAKLKPGGRVIIADSARSNLWPSLGLRSPFNTWIEWEKHQNPSEWIRLFDRAGFKCETCRWAPFYPIGRLSGTAAFQYLTLSNFVMHFSAV
jgi:SAM-dependent methyltransferase